MGTHRLWLLSAYCGGSEGEGMAKRTRIVAEVTLLNGRKTTIDMTTEPWNYDADMAKLREIYGENNVEEKS